MSKLSVLAIVTAFANLASAVGHARVVNNCSFPMTLWSVGGEISGPYPLKPGNSYSEAFWRDPRSGGIAIKITTHPNGLYNGDPQTIFAYNLNSPAINYDLSTVFGNALEGRKLVVASGNPDCPAITWYHGVPPAIGSGRHCDGAREDLTLTLCAN